MLGSAVSYVALPLVGVLVLKLDALQMGLIATAGRIPAAIVSPFVGSVVDRVRRRGLLVLCDVFRGALVGSVPISAAAGVLSYPQLLIVSAGLGLSTLLFNVAHQTALPEVVDAEDLTSGNSKLEASQAGAEIGGPGVAASLMSAGGPALAVVVDALSYWVSAVCLSRLKFPARAGNATGRPAAPGSLSVRMQAFWSETVEGFRYLWSDSILRSLSLSYSSLALFAQLQEAVYMLFLVRTVHFGATKIGVVFTLAALVGFVAALVSDKVAKRWGIGRLVVVGQSLMVLAGVLLAAVAGSTLRAGGTMLAAEAFMGVGLSFHGVGNRTLNQTRIPRELRGRVIGASRVLTAYLVAIAGVVGGSIASAFGLRTAMAVGAGGMLVALSLVLRPSVWSIRGDCGPGGEGRPVGGAPG